MSKHDYEMEKRDAVTLRDKIQNLFCFYSFFLFSISWNMIPHISYFCKGEKEVSLNLTTNIQPVYSHILKKSYKIKTC